MRVESLESVDLTVLFPSITPAEIQRIHQAVNAVDTVRLPEGHFKWDWAPEHIKTKPRPGILHTVFGTTLTLSSPLSDWLELNLSVFRDEEPRFMVSATLDVACWCEPDHNSHEIRSSEWLVGTGTALADAFKFAADLVIAWSAEALSCSEYRFRAGLPNPPEETPQV